MFVPLLNQDNQALNLFHKDSNDRSSRLQIIRVLSSRVPKANGILFSIASSTENVGQEGVMDWLKDSIESFVIGYNVSLLAYGQSGAGKSYTMGTSGPSEQNDPWQMGIL